VELCGPIRLLRATDDGGLVEVRIGKGGGLTIGQLSLLAYLSFVTTYRGGVDAETAAVELWSTHHPDGTLRQIRPDTFKKRVWSLRRALTNLVNTGNPKDVLPDAADHRYQLHGIASDWTELMTAIRRAEATTAGTAEWANPTQTILCIVRPPGLLTPPAKSHRFAWLDHHEPAAHDATRRTSAILATHAAHLTRHDDPRQALGVLATARAISTTYTHVVATATVTALLATGDVAAAETEVAAYERQLDPVLATRERNHPTPGGPRATLNRYHQHQP
jgi:hypothetical protein